MRECQTLSVTERQRHTRAAHSETAHVEERFRSYSTPVSAWLAASAAAAAARVQLRDTVSCSPSPTARPPVVLNVPARAFNPTCLPRPFIASTSDGSSWTPKRCYRKPQTSRGQEQSG